ncbi:MAG: pyridoxal-phosphate dependent enzyme [Candidatus Bathyarchaeia archaeon]
MGLQRLIDRAYQEGLKPNPIEEVKGIIEGHEPLFIKKEFEGSDSEDPLRTIKRKPALMILLDSIESGMLKEKQTIVSASSGNYVYELGIMANRLGYRVLGFVPPRIPQEKVEFITSLGVDLVKITQDFDLCPRETTVFLVRNYAERLRSWVYNADQYILSQNITSHYFLTAREIYECMKDDVDFILIGTGTTGSMGGITLFYKQNSPKVRVIGVQPTLKHNIPGVHHITIGNGCEWHPEIYSAILNPEIVTIDDIDAYASLIKLWERGIQAGPSSGLVIAYAEKLAKQKRDARILALLADNDYKYYDCTGGILEAYLPQIIKRYPELEGLAEKYMDYLKRMPTLKQRLEAVRKFYRSSRKGNVYSWDEFEEKKMDILKGLSV